MIPPEEALARHILRLVHERLGHSGSEAVHVGGVYLVDRLSTSGYAFLRRRGARGKDRIVLLAKPRPRRRSVELQAPITLTATEKLSKAVLGHRVRTVRDRSAFDVTRNSLLVPLADRISQLVGQG